MKISIDYSNGFKGTAVGFHLQNTGVKRRSLRAGPLIGIKEVFIFEICERAGCASA
jgi:hypothetical protein